MKKNLLIITFVLMTTMVVGQFNNDSNTLTIHGFTVDNSTTDTVKFALVELVINNDFYFMTKSDIYGFFEISICADRVEGQKAELIITAIKYSQEKFDIKLSSQFPLIIKIQPDSKGGIDEDTYTDYFITRREECSMERIEEDMVSNRLHKHCDGRISRYNDIDKTKENINLWTAIE